MILMTLLIKWWTTSIYVILTFLILSSSILLTLALKLSFSWVRLWMIWKKYHFHYEICQKETICGSIKKVSRYESKNYKFILSMVN
jgi:hypothetical protein